MPVTFSPARVADKTIDDFIDGPVTAGNHNGFGIFWKIAGDAPRVIGPRRFHHLYFDVALPQKG
ncbi:MAG: hypothetical protein O7B98_15750 [Alphaproteobacteria bacterium]|nr:hypothetical protein [Alphaproteobacteria bacterium]